jgi:hypothetical protein
LKKLLAGMVAVAMALVLACSSEQATGPGMQPVEPTLPWAYNPFYPDAPYCPDGTNGAFLVRVHSYWTHAPASLTITPSSTGGQRQLQAEVYSYDGGFICRNMWDLVTWTIQDAPSSPLVTGFTPFYIHPRITQLEHINFGNGTDRVIASVGPKQTCCPTQAVGGVAADTVIINMSGF